MSKLAEKLAKSGVVVKDDMVKISDIDRAAQVVAAGPEGLKLSGEQYSEALRLIEGVRAAIAELRSFTIKQTYTDSTSELEPAFGELDKLTDAVNVLYKLYNI